MKKISIPFFFLLLSFLLSCETEIPFNGEQTAPVLVVNCLACTDSTLEASISASRFFLSNASEFTNLTNATVALYVNGTFTENLTYLDNGRYKSHYIASAGDNIRLNVSASGYEAVWSEVRFPFAVKGFQIDSNFVKSDTSLIVYDQSWGWGNSMLDTVGVTYSNILEYNIQFADSVGENNYYRLVVDVSTTSSGWTSHNYLSDFDDVVFGTKNNNLDGIFTESGYDRYNIFSDELIDGKTHTITIQYSQNFNHYYDQPDPKDMGVEYEQHLTFDLQTISKSYYLYLKSLKALEIADPFMSEPVQIYTNINGGLGIMGAWTNQKRQFKLPK